MVTVDRADADTPMMVTAVSTDGTKITSWRTGTGPALVLVHGTAVDHTGWDGVVPELAPYFTVYAMDRRGRGASGDGPVFALEREVEDPTS
jgi:pimeloyl-ACP methyl ester carboxylesterase